MVMPVLETERLIVRPFTLDDLEAIHHILGVELAEADFGSEGAQTVAGRRQWLEWTVRNYEELAKLYQPPYGERAVARKADGRLIGAVGYAPCLGPFGQLPFFQAEAGAAGRLFTTELGLYYALSPAVQRQGYAAEAVGAMIDYAFDELRLRRIVATTTYDNVASQGVMRKVGMRIERNPLPEPFWFQVVGIVESPA